MKAGSLVYHGAFGFGRVTDAADAAGAGGGKPTAVRFADGSVNLIQEPYLIAVPQDFCGALAREDDKTVFSALSYIRGLSYFRAGAVKEIGVGRNPFAVYGRVKGNALYMTRVSWSGGRFHCACSCPVGTDCKHAAALLMEIRKQLSRLQEPGLSPSDGSGQESVGEETPLRDRAGRGQEPRREMPQEQAAGRQQEPYGRPADTPTPEAELIQLSPEQEHERQEHERERRMKQELRLLTEQLADPEERLRPEALVKAEFRFSRRDYRGIFLEMRVGIERSYVVKDLRGFFQAMADEERVSFGKGLSFVPRPDNFVPEDRPALALLQAFAEQEGLNPGEDKRYLPLRDSQAELLLNTLKGRYIYFENETYLVSKQELEGKFHIDARGCLSLREMPPLDAVCDTGRRLFVLSSAQQRIWPVAGSRREQQLMHFVLRNQDQPLGKQLEPFRDRVYAHFPERFTVDEALREKMQLSSLELRAYFDYRDRQILLNARCLQGGRPCSPETLVSPAHRSLWERFREETEALGFGPEEDGGTRYLREDGAVLSFLRADLSALKTLCRVYLSESLKSKTLTAFAPQSFRIEGQGTMFRVFLEESSYSDAELEQVLKALRQKKKYLLLSGDRIVTLESQEALDFAETVKTLGLKDGNLREGQEVSFARTLRAIARGRSCRPDEYLSRLVEDIRGFKTADKPLPPLEVELRPYQREGFNWMRILAEYQLGGILADEMGLGKTLESITLLAADEEPGPSLVVCPKSLIFNWCSELARLAPQLKVREIYGSQPERRERIRAIDPREKCLYVTSYDALRLDLADYGTEFSYLILDEAQYIKNVTAQKSRSVKQLAARHRFALTGTPIENSLLDLWSIFDFLLPGYFDSLESFRSGCKNDEAYAERVRTLAAPFILRRTKAEVLADLPEKFERVMTAEMTEAQQKIYDALKMQARDQLAAGGTAFSVLPSLMRLRQAAVDPGLFLEAYDGGSGKLELLRELVRDYVAQGHRLLIFSQFVQALDRVEALLQEEGLPFFRITGDTPARERVRQMEDFNREERVPVFLISLKAGGTGLNLVGADTVLQLDPWWNVAAENQASDRAHRIGQTRQVEVIRLISAGSVEQRVLELQRQKKDLIGRVISDSDASVTGITLEDIEALLQ